MLKHAAIMKGLALNKIMTKVYYKICIVRTDFLITNFNWQFGIQGLWTPSALILNCASWGSAIY